MPKFHVYMTGEVSNAGTFEADTVDDAIQDAHDTLTIDTCHQCPDSAGDASFIVTDEDGNEVHNDHYGAGLQRKINKLESILKDALPVIREMDRHLPDFVEGEAAATIKAIEDLRLR